MSQVITPKRKHEPLNLLIRESREVERFIEQHYGLPFAFDLETSGLDYLKDRTLGLALSFENGDNAYICIEHTVERPHFSAPSPKQFIDRQAFVDTLQPFFNQTDVEMVAHNLKFDLHFLRAMGLNVRGRVADTMLAAVLLDENRSVGLKKLAYLVGETMTEFTELERYPGFGKEEFLGVPLEIGAKYAMHDTAVTWKLWQRFATEMVEEGVDHAFRDIWMPLCVTLQQMERKGIALDIDLVKQTRDEAQAKAQELSERVNAEGIKMVLERYAPEDIPKGYLEIVQDEDVEEFAVETDDGRLWWPDDDLRLPLIKPTPRSKWRKPTFNTGSTKHMTELLFEHYKLRPPGDLKLKRTQSGEYSVDRNTLKVLDYMLGEESPQVLKDLLAWRKANKFLTAFLNPFVEMSDPNDHYCLRTWFRQEVAATGRLSSSQPNIQQIPSRGEEGKQARSMFVARPGHKLIVADYAAMELRIGAHYSQDETMMRAFTEGLDLHSLTASTQSGIPYDALLERIANGDTKAKDIRNIGKVSNFCVPLDTLCLTRSGWKRHDEIEPGVDETVGFNPRTGQNEWTVIEAVNVFEDAELVKLGNEYWSVVTTPEHRWWGEKRSRWKGKRYTTPQFISTSGINSETRVRVAAPLTGGGQSTATPQEAALIAWLWTDGIIRRSQFVGASSQGKYGHKTKFHAEIFQIKPDHHQHLELFVLAGVPHTKFQRADGNTVWHPEPQYMRDLWQKLDMDSHTAESFVLSLSEQARHAFLDAVERADGYECKGRFIAQETGMPDAVRLLIYLSGSRPAGSNGKHRFGKDHITGQRLTRTPTGRAPVWCPTTALGTWTMKQGREICLTGNSLVYGMAARKFQVYLLVENNTRVTLEEADRLIQGFNATYDGMTDWKRRVVRYAKKVGYIQTIAGRKRRLPELWSDNRYEVMRAERQAVNAVIQGSCADIVAEAIPAIQQALEPLGAYVLLQVHDEIVAEAPEENAEAARIIVQTYMTSLINPRLRVPLEAEAHLGSTWGEAK